ncbi:hypothetical protein JYT72_01860 [Crocinitomix catalasitica]|nr:hypothetical protein [Crocinitomix catalasitica]
MYKSKRSLGIILSSVILISCGGSGEEDTVEEENENYCDCTELFFDEPYNRFYVEDRKQPFTGKCEEFHSNGELKMEKNFVDGKVDGKMITYYDNGQKKDFKEFKENFQTGESISYTRSGEVKFHALYKRGKQTEVLLTRPDLSEDD